MEHDASKMLEAGLHSVLIDIGVKLIVPPAAVDELLVLLENVEKLLGLLKQDPSDAFKEALLSIKKGLMYDKLFKHSNTDVQVLVLSCIHQLLRITAPKAPYGDDVMKEIFEQTLFALEKNLTLFSGRGYTKALRILETLAKFRSSLILQDLGCDALVIKMFQLFLGTIRSKHPDTVFSNMEVIMTMLIEESDELSIDLLKPVLSCVKKETQNISPLSRRLGAKVLKNCSHKVMPFIMKQEEQLRLDLEKYTNMVAAIWHEMTVEENVNETAVSGSNLVQRPGNGTAGASSTVQSPGNGTAEASNTVQRPGNSTAGVSNLVERPGNGTAGASNLVERPGNDTAGVSNLVERLGNVTVGASNLVEMPGNGTAGVSNLVERLGNGTAGASNIAQRLGNITAGENSSCKSALLDVNISKECCQTDGPEQIIVNESAQPEALESEEAPRRRRRRKPNTSRKPEEGYEYFSVSGGGNAASSEASRKRKHLSLEKSPLQSKSVPPDQKHLERGQKKKKLNVKNEVLTTEESGVKEYKDELIGSKIQVWWPADRKFYEGVVESYDPSKKKHKVLYDDGYIENLNLNKQRWLLLDDKSTKQVGGVSKH